MVNDYEERRMVRNITVKQITYRYGAYIKSILHGRRKNIDTVKLEEKKVNERSRGHLVNPSFNLKKNNVKISFIVIFQYVNELKN